MARGCDLARSADAPDNKALRQHSRNAAELLCVVPQTTMI
jgi:hypothetical protein